MIITKSEALARLAKNPKIAAEFDAATARDQPGMTRDQSVELTVKALNLKRDKSATLAKLKKESAELKAQLAKLKADAVIKAAAANKKPAPKAALAPVSQTALSDTLLSLTGAAKTSFYRQHERALKIEAMKKSNPKTITI